jgi:two-component system chemotaxis sensor kinase CheA
MITSNQSAELAEIWTLFAQESKDNLAAAETVLLQLEQDRANQDYIKALFRALHSFKGGVRMMGLTVMESLAHHAEDLIALVRDDGVALESAMIDLILAVIDRLRGMLDQVLANERDVEADHIADLIASLREMHARAQTTNDATIIETEIIAPVDPVEAIPATDHRAAEAEATSADSETDPIGVAWLFWHRHTERVLADLARVYDIANQLDQLAAQFSAADHATIASAKLTDEATNCLRAIYHSAIFHHLDSTAQIAMTLADIYARATSGHVIVNATLTDLTRECAAAMSRVIEQLCNGKEPEPGALTTLIKQAQNFVYLNADGPVFQVTRSVLASLNLLGEFNQVMTPETIARLSRALQAGEFVYTILADLDRNPSLGEAFLEWSRADDIHLITNITVYRERRTLFNFLIATPRARAALIQSLTAIDPEQNSLMVEECAIQPESARAQTESMRVESVDQNIETESRADTTIPAELIENLIGTVGVIVADHATLRRVANRLGNADVAAEMRRVINAAQNDPARARRAADDLINAWSEDARAIILVEQQIGVALDRLQEETRALRLAPVAEMLNPLQRMVQELAQRQGKLIELDLQGNDLQLDRSAMQKLAEPIRRLVWFAAAHSIENVERRRTAGKPTAGRVTVHVSAREDHAQVVIVDDGQGIDRALIAQRARELGWRDLAEENLDAILRPGFGSIGGNEASVGIDFAAMNAELRAHQGRLSVISDAGHSTRFEIYLPLDLAVMDGVVVRVGAVRYVVPVNAIQKIVAAESMHIVHSSAGGNYSMLRFEDGLVQIRTLGKNGSTADPARSFDGKLFVIVEGKQSRLALTIDELFERHQVLVRPLGQWSETQDAVGCALLGEGEVGVVLNLN